MNEKINLFAQKVLIVLIVFIFIMGLYHGAHFFLLLFTGGLIAILWRGISAWLSKRINIRKTKILPFIILLNIALLVGIFYLIAPNVTQQTQELSEKIPKSIEKIKNDLSKSTAGSQLVESIEGRSVLENLEKYHKKVLKVFSKTLDTIIDFVLILAFALFLVGKPHQYERGILFLTPKEHQKRIRDLMDRLKQVLYRWFIGKIIDMSSIFVLTIIGLWILDMPLILTFALIAFFFSFVPNIGPVISAIPPIAVALLESPQKALYVGLLYLGIQLTETYFITPNVQKKASFVPPVLLLLVQFLLGSFLGILGLFLATPLLVFVMVTVKKLYVEDYLGNYKLETQEN